MRDGGIIGSCSVMAELITPNGSHKTIRTGQSGGYRGYMTAINDTSWRH